MRDTLLRIRFNEHDWNNQASCLKKGLDCRCLLPELLRLETDIDPNEGDSGENVIQWYRFKQGDSLNVPL